MAVVTTAAAGSGSPRQGTTRPDIGRLARAAWKPVALAAFAGWVLLVGAHHEPWVDESQAWLLARDSSLSDLLLDRVRYEGSPGLWHVVLWLGLRAGLPFSMLYVVPALCAIGAAALILWRSPFPGVLRLGLVAGYFVAYQYAVVARSYALDLVLVPALAVLFDRRADRPVSYALLIGLLANTNAYGFLAAAMLGCDFAVTLVRARAPRMWPALGLAAGLGLFALACAWPPADAGFLAPDGNPPAWFSAARFVTEAFVDRLPPWDAAPPTAATVLPAVMASVAMLALSLILAYRARHLTLGLILIGSQIVFAAVVYSRPWHAGFLVLLWIFLMWICWVRAGGSPRLRRLTAQAMCFVCATQAVEAARSGVWDLRHAYSGAPQAAPVVGAWRDSNAAGTIGALGFKTFALQPYFPANIFANYHAGASTPAYLTWRKDDPWRPFPHLSNWDGLARAGYGLLVVSTAACEVPPLAACEARLYAAGYRRLWLFPGQMIWKGRVREADGLMLFARDSAASAAVQSAASDSSQ